MKTKLLSKLRKKAHELIYLIPWRPYSTVQSVIVVDNSGCETKYYGQSKSNVSCYGYVIEDIVSTDAKDCRMNIPFSLNEGLERLQELRRNYIIGEIDKLKKKKEDKEMHKSYKKTAKELKKY